MNFESVIRPLHDVLLNYIFVKHFAKQIKVWSFCVFQRLHENISKFSIGYTDRFAMFNLVG